MGDDTNSTNNCNQNENPLAIDPSLGMGNETANHNHRFSYTHEPSSNQYLKHANNAITTQKSAMTDIAYSENLTFSNPSWPSRSDVDNSNRVAIAEQAVAQSVRNIGFVNNVNMNFNHQQMNALSASLNSASSYSNLSFPALQNAVCVPDVSASLSNTNGFRNNHNMNFSTESISAPNINNNHNHFSTIRDNSTDIDGASHVAERYLGGPSGLTTWPLGGGATALSRLTDNLISSGSSSLNKNNTTENKRRGVEGRETLNPPFTKRPKHSQYYKTQDQRRTTPASSEQHWVNTTGCSQLLYIDKDEVNLSQYQCLARKQMEIFEATSEDAGNNAQGRNRPILPGQIGIRCRHCYTLSPKQRKTGSVYYPNRVRIVASVVYAFCTATAIFISMVI